MILVQSLLGANLVINQWTIHSKCAQESEEVSIIHVFALAKSLICRKCCSCAQIYEHLESYLAMYIHVQATLVYFHDLDVHLMMNHELTRSIAFEVVQMPESISDHANVIDELHLQSIR